MFRKLDLFPSSGKGRETPTLLGPLERAHLSNIVNGHNLTSRVLLCKHQNWTSDVESSQSGVLLTVTSKSKQLYPRARLCFLLDLYFSPEDGSSMLVANIGNLLPEYLRWWTFSWGIMADNDSFMQNALVGQNSVFEQRNNLQFCSTEYPLCEISRQSIWSVAARH
jgi:hypothetical protein